MCASLINILLVLNDHNFQSAVSWLSTQDPILAKVYEKYGSPPFWSREPGFPSLVHIILEQQVSLESALAAFNKLKAAIGVVIPSEFLGLSDEELLQIGFSRQKKRYVRELALAIQQGDFDLNKLENQANEVVRADMKRMVGIGDWTVDVYLLFCLKRADVLPKGDIALYESIRSLKELPKRPEHHDFIAMTETWRPWRSVGCMFLWHFYLCERGRS
ncbi:MAG: DNA-3-methyladenine glycosylase 2 family protein [Lewinellaceae bacterium]|nr:DNA-3-methyladenine glycosylase 2 family protein [Saprospiraceae bacterium]MCB9345538.1 DNA-3-methyladenine glycosylase 2 family protein [Lewinellaceae bacterium]